MSCAPAGACTAVGYYAIGFSTDLLVEANPSAAGALSRLARGAPALQYGPALRYGVSSNRWAATRARCARIASTARSASLARSAATSSR